MLRTPLLTLAVLATLLVSFRPASEAQPALEARAPSLAGVGRSAQDQKGGEEPFVRCTRCKNAGVKPCPEHKGLDLDQEHEVEYCSFVAACATCLGTGWVDCADCANPAVEARMQAKRELVARLAPEMAAVDEVGGRPLRKLAVPHLLIVCDVDSWKVGKKRLKDHDLGHLYARRMDALFRDYQAVLGAKDEDFEKRVTLLMWGYAGDHVEGARRFCEISGASGVKLLGARPTYSVPVVKRFYDNDDQLHRNVVHSVAHLILSHQNPAFWIGNVKGGWADEGLAHWFEERVDGVIDNYCYQEVDTSQRILWNGGNWRPALRQLLSKGNLPPLSEALEQNSDTLTTEQHGLSFAVFDYLVRLDAAKTNLLLTRMRERVSTRDALKETFGINPLQLEERVQAWIEGEYPLR